MDYKKAWLDLLDWVEVEQREMLTNPHRTTQYYSGIACQTEYLKSKMEELTDLYQNEG